ncbi:hypothetical protein [Thalassotalea profundi]|uniref:Uncharacterized protein n=1 Tax=Thalassotalea profundi TaxID=2036687 RepID=A0ABQ3IUP0_9GAMM|nr:hypothetical protein [Thalassotalea profundi]GHE93483.1 hypothetical protein GCM10011501_23590 [Thalassotalea profundi]
MKDLDTKIAKELSNEPEHVFTTSDDELFKRATSTINNQQGTKDLLALGMASIWIVFISIFMKILNPIFKQVNNNNELASSTSHKPNNRNK